MEAGVDATMVCAFSCTQNLHSLIVFKKAHSLYSQTLVDHHDELSTSTYGAQGCHQNSPEDAEVCRYI